MSTLGGGGGERVVGGDLVAGVPGCGGGGVVVVVADVEQYEQNLSSLGIFLYRPLSIPRLWALVLNRVRCMR